MQGERAIAAVTRRPHHRGPVDAVGVGEVARVDDGLAPGSAERDLTVPVLRGLSSTGPVAIP